MNEQSYEKITELIHIAVTAGLYGSNELAGVGVEELCRIYNGIGPESLCPEVRAKLTKYLHLYEAAAMIHDLQYERSDGSREMWRLANAMFLINCLLLSRDRYAWWNPRRYLAQEAAWLLYYAVESSSGWQSWQEAKAKREEREKISGNNVGETNKEKTK